MSFVPSHRVRRRGALADLAFTKYCLLQRFFVGVHHPFDCLPTCKAYTNAILLQDYCATYDPLPRPTVCIPYTVQYWQWQYLVKGTCGCGAASSRVGYEHSRKYLCTDSCICVCILLVVVSWQRV